MNRSRPIFYVYPMFKHVSWNVIGEKHCEQLKKGLRVYMIDEEALPLVEIYSNPLVLLHPYFYPFQKWESKLSRKFASVHGVIGIDVADSDRISPYAVRLTNYALAMIVPSSFSKKAYIKSGVKVPVHVLPHGADTHWFETQPIKTETFRKLVQIKEKFHSKLLLAYMLHSPYRKGLDLLIKIYNKVKEEYGNVVLVLKTNNGVGFYSKQIDYKGGDLEKYMSGVVFRGWLNEWQQMELFDICDMYVLTSRGGGFEHPPLLALVRGEVVLGAKGGAWEDFLPEWLLVPSKKSGQVLAGNPIHTGVGVEMLVDKAVDKILEIFNDLDDYKVRVREYVNTHVRKNFTWEKIGQELKEILQKYL